jgi:ubiquitin C-terminal hydrolase
LNRYVTKENKGPYKYKLFSVLVHSGLGIFFQIKSFIGSGSGHYYAYIRPNMRSWYKFNDDKVSESYDYEGI